MKKISYILVIFILLSFDIFANTWTKEASIKPNLTQKGEQKHWCPVCGMSIKKYYKTSHSTKLHNGKNRQYCSIRCLVVDAQTHKIDHKNTRVIDAQTQKSIKAQTAYYVVGSKIKGTMSKVSKLAFANKNDAKRFIKKYGGKIVDFKRALEIATKSLLQDIAMTNKRKIKKMYPMGKRIFKKRCKHNVDFSKFSQINQLKAQIKKNTTCKNLKPKQLQALLLYLWEVKRLDKNNPATKTITVNKSEKCPVCGMFVYKYPRWAAQIVYKNIDKKHHHSFDGVKDLMKFYLKPNKWGNYKHFKKTNISKILVSDYYLQIAIDGTKAYYVIGSDVYGPMGKELIPFKTLSSAKRFKIDHNGTKIVKFDDITYALLNKLDNNE
jgi:nitrous oxide reductase accessory protein NosL